jgi:hypothetical protein
VRDIRSRGGTQCQHADRVARASGRGSAWHNAGYCQGPCV